ncbi:hypothetical protein [Methanocaldococcus infernus]
MSFSQIDFETPYIYCPHCKEVVKAIEVTADDYKCTKCGETTSFPILLFPYKDGLATSWIFVPEILEYRVKYKPLYMFANGDRFCDFIMLFHRYEYGVVSGSRSNIYVGSRVIRVNGGIDISRKRVWEMFKLKSGTREVVIPIHRIEVEVEVEVEACVP